MFKRGHFGWHDMNTNDLDASIAFYSAVFGWQFGTPTPQGYRVLIDSGRAFGGCFPMSPQMNARSNWSGYLMVDDVTATLALAADLGGTVPFESRSLPGVGRLGIVFDPTGAMVTIFQPTGEEGTSGTGGAGNTVVWNELITNDVPAAAQFYSGLFGWTFVPEVIASGGYALARLHGEPVAGLFDTGVRPSVSAWLTYFRTEDIGTTAEHAIAHGATMIHPVTEVTGIGITTAWLNDPLDATFGLMQTEADWFDRLRKNGQESQ